jgi:hypothetical protein
MYYALRCVMSPGVDNFLSNFVDIKITKLHTLPRKQEKKGKQYTRIVCCAGGALYSQIFYLTFLSLGLPHLSPANISLNIFFLSLI